MPKPLSPQQVAQMMRRRGVPGNLASQLGQIANRESGGKYWVNNAGLNQNGTVDHGLFQINDIWRNDPDIRKIGWGRRYDPEANADMAAVVLRKQGMQAWATYGGPNVKVNAKTLGTRGATRTSTRPSTPEVDDARKTIALSLLGVGGLGDSGYGGSLTDTLLQVASQKQAAPKAPRAVTGPTKYGSGNASIMELAEIAKNRFGLSVRELAPYDKVDPVHTKGSFHYSNRAADISGNPQQMAAFNRWVAKNYGKRLKEMFYDRGVNIDNGRPTKAIGGHGSHVHVAA